GDLASVMPSSRLSGPSGTSITSASLGTKAGPTDVVDQDVMAFQSFLYDYLKASGQSGNFAAFNVSGPLDMRANFGNGQGSASFKTSLSQIANWQQKHDKTEMNALGFGHNMASTVFMPLDIWAEGNYASYSGNRSGQFGMVTLGADYVFNPNLLMGVYSQFDMMSQTSGTNISGNGWMAGPYVTARLSDTVFWQARGGWGTSSNTINGTDKFDSTRWTVSSSLSGRWKFSNGLAFSPTATFTYFEDSSDAYLDSFGVAIPGTKTSLGQLKLSPDLSYGFTTDGGLWIEPNIATELIWNFASTNINGQGQLDGTATGPAGLRGKIKGGINFKTPSGISFGATGAYDGIGSNGFSSISGQATVNIPLN
ncbi:MAG: autotransporter outer membrane beta-barrel domain-containing protein, partial [Alphaproteobacteria bacterium]|nr:autotransporter outer membrane beta-barrel domain-containing protein [Alphaproteobacteria bacterium]